MAVFLIYVIQFWFLIGLVTFLHAQRARIGLLPLLFVTVGLVVLLNFSNFINIRFTIFETIRLGIAGHLIAPIILSSLMMVYISEGYQLARVQLFSMVGVNAVVIVMLIFVTIYLALDFPNILLPPSLGDASIFDLMFLQRRIASVVAFSGAMIVIAITFQLVTNHMPALPAPVTITLAMIVALWIDSLLFFTVANLGLGRLFSDIPNDLMGKSLASLLATIPLGLYLRQFARTTGFDIKRQRPTLAILFGDGTKLQNSIQKLEAELQTNRQIYAELTHHIDEIFWMVDAHNQELIYISPSFEKITGHKRASFYTHFDHIQTIIHPEDQLPGETILLDLVQLQSNDFRLVSADGEVRWMHNQTFAIHNEKGEIYRYGGVIQDITGLKLAHQHEFELAIANERMQILHDFVRDASHDLKNPLSSILLKLDMIARYIDTEKQASMLGEVKERVIHLSLLIDDLFTLSRIEGHEPAIVDKIDVSGLVEAVVKEFQPLASEKELTLSYEAPDTVFVKANQQRLHRAISNLISNAIRYTPEGAIAVSVRRQNTNAIINVKDTGIGIPVDDIPRVFDRFFRSDNTQNIAKGTGLGLAIVRAIIESYDGKITVDSQDNDGSTFSISLPLES